MRIGAVKELLEDSGEDWWVVEELLREGEIVKVEYEGNEYYMRKISKVGGPGRTWDLHSIMVIYILVSDPGARYIVVVLERYPVEEADSSYHPCGSHRS